MALSIIINKVAVATSFAAGATIATAVASGGTTPYIYSLATGSSKFTINSSTGVVTTIAAMNIANIASFSVTATDSTSTPVTITSDVTYPNIQAAAQNRFNKNSVIYKITKDIDLGNGVLTIPVGCTLDFQGGSIINGTIVGNNTTILAGLTTIFTTIVLQGSFKNGEFESSWFGVDVTKSNNSPYLQSTIDNALAVGVNKVKLPSGTINIDAPILIYGSGNYNNLNYTELIGKGMNVTTLNKTTTTPFSTINAAIILLRGIATPTDDLYNTKLSDLKINAQGHGVYINGGASEVIIERAVINAGDTSIYVSGNIWQSTFRELFLSGPYGFRMIKSGTSNSIERVLVYGASTVAFTLRGDYSSLRNLACDDCTGICYDLSHGTINISGLGSESLKATGVLRVGQDLNLHVIGGSIFCPTGASGSIIEANNANCVAVIEGVQFGNSAYPRTTNYYLAKSNSAGNTIKFKNCSFIDTFANGYFANGYSASGSYFGIENTDSTNLGIRSSDNGAFLPFTGSESTILDGKATTGIYKASAHYFGLSSTSPIADWNGRDLGWYKPVEVGSILEPLNKTVISHWICTQKGGTLRESKFTPIFIGMEKGASTDRPNIKYNNTLEANWNPVYVGKLFFDTTLDSVIIWDGTKWVRSDGSPAVINKGTTTQRPTLASTVSGTQYYDTTLNKPIWWNGTAWIDVTGATV